MTKEVFLGVRFLISLYFILISFSLPPQERGTLIVLSSIYFTLALITYLRPDRMKITNRVLDVVFAPSLVFLSENAYSLFSLPPLIVVHTNRNPVSAGLLLVASIALSVYMLRDSTLSLFSTMILIVASPVSALIPDFLSVIRKERKSMTDLRGAYRKLLKEMARWERERKELENLRFLIDTSTASDSVEDFLRTVKDRFSVRRIHIIPKRSVDSYEVLMDRDRGLLSVPVKLEEGNAVIIFELESPFQLNDPLLVGSLERAGRMVSLYIAGFKDDSSLGRAINIS
ncbi:MAG: hypothetical protein Q9N26_05840 [Aquificota bacterium]|nr:hypothetical protein [Aquificota bacterium]